MAECMGPYLQRRIARCVNGTKCELFQRPARDRRAVTAHQHDPAGSEGARKRSAFLRLGHNQSGVTKIVARIPERHFLAQRGAKMIDPA